jgi:polyhydroxyalkanoate synthesis regulator phasin
MWLSGQFGKQGMNSSSRTKKNVDELVEEIKRQSWEWLMKRKDRIPSLLYEWLIDPLDCILR